MEKVADPTEDVHVDYVLNYLLTPACLVLAYKRLLAPQLWINVVAFFAAPGVHFFMQACQHGSLPKAAIYTLAFFALFSCIVFGGAWAEDRFVKKSDR